MQTYSTIIIQLLKKGTRQNIPINSPPKLKMTFFPAACHADTKLGLGLLLQIGGSAMSHEVEQIFLAGLHV